MGWMYSHRGSQSLKDFVVDKFHGSVWSPLDVAIVGFRTAYIAAANSDTGEVTAFIFLLGFNKNDYCDTGYKDMDESMGPYYYDCPARILKLLTPTEDTNANLWRASCRRRLAVRAYIKGLKNGDVIRTEPVTFNRCRVEPSEFTVFDKKKHLFHTTSGMLVKLNRYWLTRNLLVPEGDLIKTLLETTRSEETGTSANGGGHEHAN